MDDSPELFEKYLREAIGMVKDKTAERQLIFIRAWNEWGEGNYLEPDTDSGMGYLEALKRVREWE